MLDVLLLRDLLLVTMSLGVHVKRRESDAGEEESVHDAVRLGEWASMLREGDTTTLFDKVTSEL